MVGILKAGTDEVDMFVILNDLSKLDSGRRKKLKGGVSIRQKEKLTLISCKLYYYFSILRVLKDKCFKIVWLAPTTTTTTLAGGSPFTPKSYVLLLCETKLDQLGHL